MIEFEFLALFLAINISYGRDENNKLSAALFRQYYPIYSVRKRNSFAIFPLSTIQSTRASARKKRSPLQIR
ncbi:MAG TPA: hypothetical protein VKB89_18395 [Xanthobacteraceae bacterium]|nr:hypothetical protein [Xanthobacteraceae bacterium]